MQQQWDVGGEALLERDLNTGVRGEEAGQGFWQEAGDRRDAGVQANMAAGAGGEGLNIGEGAVEQVEERTEVAQKGFAGRGRFDAAIVPAQQGGAEAGLHLGDAAAEGRERQAFAFRGAREAALLDRRLEDAQGDEVQAQGRPGQWGSRDDSLPWCGGAS